MAVEVWAGQTSSGGLSVAATEERGITVVKLAAKNAVAKLNEDIPKDIPDTIFVIEISIG